MKHLSIDRNQRRPSAASALAGESRREPADQLRAQIDRGFKGLRFRPALEADFCRYLRVSGRLSRASLLLLALAAMLITPLVDTRLLGLPPALVDPSRWLQMGFMLPLVLAVGLFLLLKPFSRAIEPVMILLFAGLTAALMVQRAIDAHYGFDLPAEFVAITTVAMFSLARIRFWIMLPAAVVTSVAMLVNELLFVLPEANGYYHIFTTILLIVVGVFSGYSAEYFIRWTWLNAALLRHLSRTDSLTGLLNRHALEQRVELAQATARRERLSYAIAMVDIDAFGAYNERYGHQAGDDALHRVARVLSASARRPQDVCGRYGGEEFVLLWVDGDLDELSALAESVRSEVENLRIEHAASEAAPWLTVSIGVCHLDAEQRGAAFSAMLSQADRLLYRAKNSGRNRVLCERYEAREDLSTHEPRTETGSTVAACPDQ